ncbi:hypothetical protein COCC4DRAFT_149687 [Bipolaris maydis ATCC 48331]|uniref:Zn(2)-C6 fungal-type domain-containing protein n=2 Tax=Cochliobolus heterostrophus TaxID=5016 RepID=M2UK53_COCH5|nr:uncharacterized protein COCC4DRAFT_149687 [Bipolaris maydis ATCC 48331]EMD88358.1 hypothetical protein COCHEDRAFT_1216282 [Bipolaris maydis C5]KAJ5028354.1 hypothetical protein J3E73DRAFT_367271 [Bipolaris maydis]ENI00800.1 hypothetical protein COCC4DRAFT_149687 [Bipolaris maydis ATCC 48331]KAJ6206014.1 hypothetical protein PSV09DRAFT_1216282 [Bipolaris maydis]KAJ6272527.1 hypothetical protein PSV08DRAFT_349212 [Bipolaris maydis]
MALKLRDSCDACAASKVKCHKQKPTCSRCQRRGTPCHYLATKRAGRRPDSAAFSPLAASMLHWEHFDFDPSFTTRTTTPSTHSTDNNTFLHQLLTPTPLFPGATSSQPAYGWTSVAPNDDLVMAQPMFTATRSCTSSNSPELGPCAASPINLATDLDNDLPSSVSFWAPTVRGTSTVDTPPSLEPGAESEFLASNFTTPALDTCLTRATKIMQQQFYQSALRPSNISCKLLIQDGVANVAGPAPDIIIEANKQYINQVDTMLECQCSKDGYLLTIISLIVFKILDSYGTAASEPEVQKARDDSAEEHAQRIAAQRVMGELHRVQRLVNQLAIHTKRHIATESPEMTPGAFPSCEQKAEGEVSSPFSTVNLCQIEMNMKKRLRSLSLELAVHLRKV